MNENIIKINKDIKTPPIKIDNTDISIFSTFERPLCTNSRVFGLNLYLFSDILFFCKFK